jgi:hypothetical protein
MSRLQAPVTVQDHVRGGPLARVTLVEYGDYRCPRCAVTHRVLRLLEDSYGEALSVVYRHFPMAEANRVTQATAEAAEFAADHGRFWEMHDAIFANQERLCVPLLAMLAARSASPASICSTRWNAWRTGRRSRPTSSAAATAAWKARPASSSMAVGISPA